MEYDKIYYPNNQSCIFKDRTGEINNNYQGLKMTIIKYFGARNINVQFENGYIAEHKCYTSFKNGSITNPYYPTTVIVNTDIPNLLNEEWKPIAEYEDLYQVSNKGRVKALPKMVWGGRDYYVRKPQLMKFFNDCHGYLQCRLTKNTISKSFKVHRLVAMAFIPNPNPNEYDQINHIDGVKTNNCVENLEWCNCSQNIKHAFQIGLNRYTGKAGMLPRPVAQIDLQTGKIIQIFQSQMDAAHSLGRNDTASICKTCQHEYKSSGGYGWEYYKEDSNEQDKN